MKNETEKHKSSKNTLSADIKTDAPLSEKDEVKRAEEKMRKSAVKTSK